MVKVSILILTYNRVNVSAKYIPRIIDKIGDVDVEILIWDNGSRDGTYDWLMEYGRSDCRITKVFGADENIGMEAINDLAKESSGKYLLKIDDDIEVPVGFAERLVDVYEELNEDKLLYLSWDMLWGKKTFATRSGLKLYKTDKGRVVNTSSGKVYIRYNTSTWLINGACRLSPKDGFLRAGGHPDGVKYGVDHLVSKAAHKFGYYGGYFSPAELIVHRGHDDSDEYRKFKDKELRKHGAPRHV